MAKVFLAPAVNGPDLINVPDDQVIESFDAIQKKKAVPMLMKNCTWNSICCSIQRKEIGRPKSKSTT